MACGVRGSLWPGWCCRSCRGWSRQPAVHSYVSMRSVHVVGGLALGFGLGRCLVCLEQCLWYRCVVWFRGAGGHRLGCALFQVFGLRVLTMPVVIRGLASCVCVAVSYMNIYTHIYTISTHTYSGSVPCGRFYACIATVRHISQRSKLSSCCWVGSLVAGVSDGRVL